MSFLADQIMLCHIDVSFAIVKQVIIDGIGIFSMCLGEDFSSSGFLHTSLYMLLHNLSCSCFQISSASDAVLHIVAAMHDYPTVSSSYGFLSCCVFEGY